MEEAIHICPVCSCYLDNTLKQIPYPCIAREDEQDMFFSNIVFCDYCEVGIAFPEISKDRIEEFYESGSFWKQLRPQRFSLKSIPVPFALAKSRWNDIERLLVKSKNNTNVRILDVGAGYGCMGLVANKSKYTRLNLYSCVEPDSIMRQYLKSNLSQLADLQKLEIRNSIDEISGQYNVVVLSHVLEHLRDPLSMLKSALSLLAPGGILLLDVPNQDYLFKVDVFPHVLFFSFSSIKHMLDKEELIEIVSIEGRGSNMFQSPLNKQVPIRVKLAGKLIKMFYRFLPGKFLIVVFAKYFGVDRVNSNGTWIRALSIKKELCI